ncbi:MAG: 30S ribosomal protein S7 [Bacteroidetes bacterium]|nr:30S ribosomal protein S7 [Bacteroidota bacterium]
MRKARAKKRILIADPRYNDVMITKFVNNMMMNGKKNLAFDIFYQAMDLVEARTKENGLEVFKAAIENVTPAVEVRSRRVGGATFQIPREVRPERKLSLAIKWMIDFARKRNEKSMSEKLAGEIIAGSKEEGGAFKKKADTHKMAAANKAFSHFRF